MMKFAIAALALCFTAWGQSQNLLNITPKQDHSVTGEVRFFELFTSGQNYVGLKAAGTMAGNTPYTLPVAYPSTTGDCLTSTTAGVTAWLPCGANAWVNGGNSFGAAGFFGTNDNFAIGIKTNNLQRWTFDAGGAFLAAIDNTHDIGAGIGVNSPRSIYSSTSVVSKNADFAPAGLIGNYTKVRKLEIADVSGATTFWDVQAAANPSGNSMLYVRDNAGSRAFSITRAIAATPANSSVWYATLAPAKRAIADGDAVDDSVFPSLGEAAAPWAIGHFGGGAAGFYDALNVRNTTTGAYGSCVVLSATDTVSSTVYGAGRICGRYTSNNFNSEEVTLQTATGSGTYQNALTLTNDDVTIADTLFIPSGAGITGQSGSGSVFQSGSSFSVQTGATLILDAAVDSNLHPAADGVYSLGEAITPLRWLDIQTYGLTVVGNVTITGTCTGCGGGLPVVDTTAVVKGSADATKSLAFEVDGFTTATTRTLTPQNASYTIAGTNLSQTFSNIQTFTGSIYVDRAAIGNNQQLYWTIAGSNSGTGTWTLGTVPYTTDSSFVLTHNGTNAIQVFQNGQIEFSNSIFGTSGTLTGGLSAANFNGTGSNPFRVSGTGVIDSSRNASFVGITASGVIALGTTVTGDYVPTANDTYSIGTTGAYLNMIRSASFRVHGVSIAPSSSGGASSGSVTLPWSNTYTNSLIVNTGTTAPNGSAGYSGTGAACVITAISGGFITGATC